MSVEIDIPTKEPRPPTSDDTLQAVDTSSLYRRLAIPAFAVSVSLVCVVIVSADWNGWVAGARRQLTDDAVVNSDVSTLSAQVSGTVRSVAISDYQQVSRGDLLAQIDDREYVAAVDIAVASLGSIQAMLDNLGNQIDLQQAAIVAASGQKASAAAQLAQTEQEFRRQTMLGGATSQQALQQAHSAYLQAKAAVQISEAAIEQQKAQLKVLGGQYPLLRSQIAGAQGNLDTARLRLSYTRIYAPFDGVTGRKLVHEGDLVSIGSGIVSLVPLPAVYVSANFKETQLSNMKIGDHAEITVDSFPGQRLSGTVSSLAPASGSIFALLPPDNATGNYTKVVQRVPARIDIDPGQPLTNALKAGLSVTVAVETPAGAM
jgi:membrane fusion protein (multidrug efflux system)